MTLKDREMIQQVKDLITEIKFRYPEIKWGEVRSVVLDNAIKRFGLCCYRGNDSYEISISRLTFKDHDQLVNTVIHEMLHTVKGSKGHGTVWKRNAEYMTRKTGMLIKRTSAASEAIHEEKMKKMKYKVVCEGCGQIIYRARESDIVKNTCRYRCGKCHKSLFTVYNL